MGALVSHCEWLAAELDCFVLLVHHCGKDEAKGLRGHTSLLGAINSEIEVRRQRGEVGTATVSKQRDGADGAQFAFDLEQVLLGQDDVGDEVSSCVAVCADSADVPKDSGSRKLPDGLQVALNALTKALGDEGQVRRQATTSRQGFRLSVNHCGVNTTTKCTAVTVSIPSKRHMVALARVYRASCS